MNATVTTPSGVFTVNFPKTWQAFRALANGEELRKGDRVVSAGGKNWSVNPAFFCCRCVIGRIGTKFPPGYYFRPTKQFPESAGRRAK